MCNERPLARQRGMTLIELIMFMVIVSVGIAGILGAINVSTRNSADPMIRKQQQAIAESLLEEVQLAPFTFCDPIDPNVRTAASAAACAILPARQVGEARPFDNVIEYDGIALGPPIPDITGTAVPAIAAYSAAIAVAPAALGGIAAASGDALLITVTVTPPSGPALTQQGYRTRYAPNATP